MLPERDEPFGRRYRRLPVCPAKEIAKKFRVPPSGLFGFTAFGKLLERIGPYRFEQPPAAGGRRSVQRDQRLCDEICDAFDDRRRSTSDAAHDGGRRIEGESGGEYRQAAQQPPSPVRAAAHSSSRASRAVSDAAAAPFGGRRSATPKRSSRRAATCWSPSAAARAAANSMASGMPSRRRQIAAIAGRFSPCGEKSERNRLCPGDEQLHRAVPEDICPAPPDARGGTSERRNAIDVLALDPQDLAAGCQNRRARTQARERFRQLRRRVDDVFAIVENKEEFSSTDRASDGLGGNLVAAQLQPEDAGDRGRHQTGIRQRGQFDKPTVALKVGEQVARDLQRQRGLPDPTRPRQRHHPIGRQKIPQMLHSRGPADQARMPPRENCSTERLVQTMRVRGRNRSADRCPVLPDRPAPEQAIAATGRRLQHVRDPGRAPCGPRRCEPGAYFPRRSRPATRDPSDRPW